MQVSFNNITYSRPLYLQAQAVSSPQKGFGYDTAPKTSITFQAATVLKPVMSTKIYNEKARLLKKINEILKTNIPMLDEKQFLEVIERRAIAIIRMKISKKNSFESELEAIYNSPYMSQQQKFNRVCEIEKEEKKIDKIDPFAIPDYLLPKEAKENYDYKLIEKFKLALNDNNFDLRSIYQEHYSDLSKIQTVEELKEAYPSIVIPPQVEDVIIEKIIDTFPRSVYETIDQAGKMVEENVFSKLMLGTVLERVVESLFEFGIRDHDYIEKMYVKVIDRLTDRCIKLVKENRLKNIAQTTKNEIPAFTKADKDLFEINYDKFVLHVLNEHYINGKKLNEIIYTEGEKTIKVADLKGSAYKFEKFSENIKRIITDSEKLRQYQREYLKFTAQELKDRLMFYESTEFGYDNDLFNLFVEFESCKFTEEDRNNLIILLKELDKISDGIKTLEEGKEFLAKSNIRPHGTNKINEAAKEEARAQIRAEQQRMQTLNTLRKEFNTTVNKLYELEMITEADMCMKYYPLSPDATELKKSEAVIRFVEKCINTYDSKIARTKIARWEVYNEYLANDKDSPAFKDAIRYCKSLKLDVNEDNMGQYLLNRELVDGYPESARLVSEPDVVTKVMESTSNKDFAARLLCKYENYKLFTPEEKTSILNILKIFDDKNELDRVLLKHIIEKDYINCDTTIFVERENVPQARTICDSAKQQLFEKYNFPNSLPFFEKFEQALSLDATFQGTAGVKKLTRNYKNKREKAEVKIVGHDDRLVADFDDYRFNRFDPKGIH